jgi:hypothetical protein
LFLIFDPAAAKTVGSPVLYPPPGTLSIKSGFYRIAPAYAVDSAI